MKRDELSGKLQQEYKAGLPCGVSKIPGKDYENIWFVVPPPPPTTLPSGLNASIIAKATRVIEELPKSDQLSELDKLVSYLFVRREAVQSSRMEGTWSTIDHILSPGDLFDKKEAKSERASVLGYANALEAEFAEAFKKSNAIFTQTLIGKLHKNIMSKDPAYRGSPGKIRATPVFIGGLHRKENSIYNPTPPEFVDRCLKQVVEWLSNEEIAELGDAGMGLPLVARMAIGHSHFEAVHPFTDGNGRVGRMLMTLQMAAHRALPLYISGFIEAEKDQYMAALQAAQKKLNYVPIIEFIAEAIIASHQETQETRTAIEKLPDDWKARGSFRDKSAAQRLLRQLMTHPIFTVKEVEKSLEVSKPAANKAVKQLIKAGIIRERTGDARYRVFAAEEVIELLARKFAEPTGEALARAKELLK